MIIKNVGSPAPFVKSKFLLRMTIQTILKTFVTRLRHAKAFCTKI